MTCYICKKTKPELSFTRKGKTFKSCNACSKSKSIKRRENRIKGILGIYCPVDDINSTITSLVLHSEESDKHKQQISEILMMRNTLSERLVRYFLRDRYISNILMCEIIGMGDEEDLLDYITHKCLDLLMAYIKQKVLKSKARRNKRLIEDILNPSTRGSFANLIYEKAHLTIFYNTCPQSSIN